MKALEQKVAAVIAAEQACDAQRADANGAWQRLKWEVRRSATPGRIVVSGLVLGFASGFTSARATGAAGSKLLAGPIFSMLLDTVVPGVMAGLTAAATDAGEDENENEDEDDGDAEATEDEAQYDADAGNEEGGRRANDA